MDQKTQENLLFENKYIVSVEGAKSYRPSWKNTNKKNKDNKSRQYLLPTIGLGVAAVIFAMAWLTDNPLFTVFGMALAGLYVFRLFAIRNKQVREQVAPEKIYKPVTLTWKRIINFYEDHLDLIDPNESPRFFYADIEKFSETNMYLNLFFKDKAIVRVHTKGFTVGDYETFFAWIREKVRTNEDIME